MSTYLCYTNMNIVITDPVKCECFGNLFQHVRLFSEHVNITFDKERMYMQSMDSSRVSVFELSLPADWFDVYEYTVEESCTLGINTSMLFKILNTRDKIQNTHIRYDPNGDDSDKLFVRFDCENKSVFDKLFEIPLMDLDCDVMEIPAGESDAEFSIASTNFASIIAQLKLFGDTIEVRCDEDKIELHSISLDTGKMTVCIDIDDLTSYAITEDEKMDLSFSLSILHNICQYHKVAKEVEIHLTKDFPMKLIYHLGADNATFTFYLAPKISDSE